MHSEIWETLLTRIAPFIYISCGTCKVASRAEHAKELREMMCKRWIAAFFLIFLLFYVSGCEVLLVGGAAGAGYKIGTDQKSVGETLGDATITATIKMRLLQDKEVHGLNIDVDTNLGEVTLSGYVQSEEEIRRAVIIAKGVRGVKKVTNLLKVRRKR